MAKAGNKPDIVSGVTFILFGLAGFAFGRDLANLQFGEIGPGLFPRMISGLLVVIGLVELARGLRGAAVGFGAVPWRALLPVLGGVLAFGFLIDGFGLVLAVAGAAALSGAAAAGLGMAGGLERRRRIVELALVATALAAVSVLIFVLALDLPLEAWP